jgi:two-component system alkaline phosphatase synthesis response regulator PhoP
MKMKKILLADDDEGIVDALSIILEVNGYEVEATLDGSKVTGMLDQTPDLIILDTWMSGIDGRDVCKDIKTNPSTREIPVLMISASHDIRESALNAGADQFMEKPFEMQHLLKTVAHLSNKTIQSSTS